MFQRREKVPFYKKVVNFFWPQIGWKRSSAYMFHRLGRLPGTPYNIASGFAIGAAVSFTPFIGLHFIISGIIAWCMRAGVLASAIGTVVGNPWTFPFIWVLVFNVGNMLLGRSGEVELPDGAELTDLSLGYIFDNFAILLDSILWPMLLGSLPIGVVVWVIFYVPLYILVKKYQQSRIERWKKSASQWNVE